jgi:hypothetical protein
VSQAKVKRLSGLISANAALLPTGNKSRRSAK